MSIPPNRRPDQGFTMIELLVVMAIIATLAALGAVGIPRILRQADKTAAKSRLTKIYEALMIYHGDHRMWPKRSGALFPLTVWDSGIVDHTQKDAEIFYDPSTNNVPPPELESMDEFAIDWTGPDLEGRRMSPSPSMRNAADVVIVCNKIPPVQSESDLNFLPHAAKGMVYLTAGGNAEWIDASEFGDYPIIGEESPIEKFRWMKVYDGY